ncbi:MAG: 30S ribosomal protein S20 [Eubacteriales bacterium]|nr:30S ribosomal protein S20 [Eubacteriales bacterium]
MPNIKSAIKRTRSTARKTAVNKSAKSELRTMVKQARVAIETGSENAEASLRETQQRLQQMAVRGHMHKNQVARRMSRLQKALNKTKA